MRRVLFLTEKHGNRVFHADTDEDLEKSAKAIVSKRIEAGSYYDDVDIEEAHQVITSSKKLAAYNFLLYRSDCEYEKVTLYHVEEAK